MYKTSNNLRGRLARLRGGGVGLLGEALVELTAASLKVRFIPFRRITSAITRSAISADARPVDIDRLRWAIQAAARRLPLRTKCIETALALQAMLRRRGVASVLHYGVRRDEEGTLGAHVWLTIEGEFVIGGESAAEFACVATFATPVSH
ncbi:MAG: lasso peptide biosynthesis B2 protein [Pseudomonadota bacterium]|nr:lasso peptide biosynthesis B2 protein [Pseudomonadota bacterium]